MSLVSLRHPQNLPADLNHGGSIEAALLGDLLLLAGRRFGLGAELGLPFLLHDGGARKTAWTNSRSSAARWSGGWMI